MAEGGALITRPRDIILGFLAVALVLALLIGGFYYGASSASIVRVEREGLE